MWVILLLIFQMNAYAEGNFANVEMTNGFVRTNYILKQRFWQSR